MELSTTPKDLPLIHATVVVKKYGETDFLVGRVSRTTERFKYRAIGAAERAVTHAEATMEGVLNVVNASPLHRKIDLYIKDNVVLEILQKGKAHTTVLSRLLKEVKGVIKSKNLEVRYKSGGLREIKHHQPLPREFWG